MQKQRRSGDTDAESRFRQLFDANYRAILAYGLRRTPSRADASDLAADTMLVAWRRIDDVPQGGEALPWLYGVARLALANQSRTSRRRDQLSARLATAVEQVTVPDVAQASADRAWVLAALAELNDLDREVLTLTLWEGLSQSEVAVAVNAPASTVRTRLHRARGRLREHLEASADEHRPESGHDPLGKRLLIGDGEETR